MGGGQGARGGRGGRLAWRPQKKTHAASTTAMHTHHSVRCESRASNSVRRGGDRSERRSNSSSLGQRRAPQHTFIPAAATAVTHAIHCVRHVAVAVVAAKHAVHLHGQPNDHAAKDFTTRISLKRITPVPGPRIGIVMERHGPEFILYYQDSERSGPRGSSELKSCLHGVMGRFSGR